MIKGRKKCRPTLLGVHALSTLNPGSLQTRFIILNKPLKWVILQFRNWGKRKVKTFPKVQVLSRTEGSALEYCLLILFSDRSPLLRSSASVFLVEVYVRLRQLYSVVSKDNYIKTKQLGISRGLQGSMWCSSKTSTTRKVMNAMARYAVIEHKNQPLNGPLRRKIKYRSWGCFW